MRCSVLGQKGSAGLLFCELTQALSYEPDDLVGAQGLVSTRVVDPEQEVPSLRAARTAGEEDEALCLRRIARTNRLEQLHPRHPRHDQIAEDDVEMLRFQDG